MIPYKHECNTKIIMLYKHDIGPIRTPHKTIVSLSYRYDKDTDTIGLNANLLISCVFVWYRKLSVLATMLELMSHLKNHNNM